MKKMFIRVLTAVSLLASTVSVSAASTSFVDIEDSYAKVAILDLKAKGIIDGIDDIHFNPKGILTRVQFVAIIDRALGIEAKATTSSFTDVTDWAIPYVEAAFKAGIIEGVANGLFDPNASITREAAVTILVRSLKIKGKLDEAATISFTDADQISEWAKPFVSIAIKYGLISGYPDGTFDPKGIANREMAATMGINLLTASTKLAQAPIKTEPTQPKPDTTTTTPTGGFSGGGGGGGGGSPGGISITPATVAVTAITITGVDAVAKGQTAQLGVDVTPINATNKSVTWSVTNVSGSATIDANGLLTTTGFGVVTVKAVAKDGSLVEGIKNIAIQEVPTISGGKATFSNGTTIEGIPAGATIAGNPTTVTDVTGIKVAGLAMNFTFTGTMPAEGVVLTLPTTSDDAALSYYNTQRGKWELQSGSTIVTIGNNKFVKATVNHFSIYAPIEKSAQLIADSITTVAAPAKDATSLTLPTVVNGFTVTIKSSDKPDVIALNGTITPPSVQTTVAITLEVTRVSDNSKAVTVSFNVVVPAKSVVPTLTDLTAYNNALGQVSEDDYTEASWTAYQVIVTANVVTIENTQARVDAATVAIINAQQHLVQKVTNPAEDEIAPVITLNGKSVIDVVYGLTYTDAGATALDNVDGDITSAIVTTITNVEKPVGNIDTTIAGTYIIHYNVTDTSGNKAVEVIRTVTVVGEASEPTLASIKITTPASKLIYAVGDTLDLTGLVVTGKYSDGTTEVLQVTTANVIGFNSSSAVAKQTLTVTIDGYSATYDISIVAVPVTPEKPSVTVDDIANKVNGMIEGTEYKIDSTLAYSVYEAVYFDAIDFSGDHTLYVRVAAVGINPPSNATILQFTTNQPEPSHITTVTSAVYTVSSAGEDETVTNITYGTSKADFLKGLIKGDINQTWGTSGIHDPVVTGDKLVVTAQDGITIVIYRVTINGSPTIWVSRVRLDKPTLTMKVNATPVTLVATVQPTNATNKAVTWFSSDPSVASVVDRKVTPLTKGTTAITVTTMDGNYTATSVVTVTEDAIPDTIAPSAPVGLSATLEGTQVILTWSANQEVDLAGYNVYQGGTKVNSTLLTVTGTTYTVTGLTYGTTYSFQVSAVDNAGNESAKSLSVSATPTATVENPETLLSNPTLTVYAPNVDSEWAYDGQTYAPNTAFQVNINFNTGTTTLDFKAAEVSVYNGNTLLATHKAKSPLLTNSYNGLSDVFIIGELASMTDNSWEIGAYTSSTQKPTNVKFTLTDKSGVLHIAEASYSEVTLPVASENKLSSPSLVVYAPNLEKSWTYNGKTYAPNTAYQVNVNFAAGTTSSDFKSAVVSLYDGTTLLSSDVATQLMLSGSHTGLTDVFGIGDVPTSDSYWFYGGYQIAAKPTRAVFKLVDKTGAVHIAETSMTLPVITGLDATQFLQPQDYSKGLDGYNLGFQLNLANLSYNSIASITGNIYDGVTLIGQVVVDTPERIQKFATDDETYGGLDGQLSFDFHTDSYLDTTTGYGGDIPNHPTSYMIYTMPLPENYNITAIPTSATIVVATKSGSTITVNYTYAAIPPVAATLTTIGATGINDLKVYQQFELAAGGQPISLASSNVYSMYVLKPNGTTTKLVPDADTSLWFNVQNEAGDYKYTVVAKDGKNYEATLHWAGATQVTAQATVKPHATIVVGGVEKTYAEYEFVGIDLSGPNPFDAMYQINQPADGVVTVVPLTPNGDSNPNLWHNVSKVDGTYTYLIKNGNGWKQAEIVVQGVTGVTLDQSTMTVAVGATATLNATVNPTTATFKDVKWSSSDTTIATVSANGVVTAVGNGTATITATTLNGLKTATSEVIAGDFASGTGTFAAPYIIKTTTHLDNVRKNLTAYYALDNNIDLSAYSEGEGWLPIGSVTTNAADRFTGSFNGNGYTIDNLFSNRSIVGVGLFGAIGNTGVIDNVKMGHVNLTGARSVGAVVGRIYKGGIVKNSSVAIGKYQGVVRADPAINGEDNADIGGLVGFNYGGTVENSSTLAIRIDGDNRLGGLVGNNWGIIKNSHASAILMGSFLIGGLTGLNYTDTTISVDAVIENSYSQPYISSYGIDSRIGGIAGNNTGTIRNSFAIGSVSGENNIGGITATNSGTIVNSYAANTVTRQVGSTIIGGVAGQNVLGGTVTSSYYDSQISRLSDSGKGDGKTTAQMQDQTTFIGWDFTTVWTMVANYYPLFQYIIASN